MLRTLAAPGEELMAAISPASRKGLPHASLSDMLLLYSPGQPQTQNRPDSAY